MTRRPLDFPIPPENFPDKLALLTLNSTLGESCDEEENFSPFGSERSPSGGSAPDRRRVDDARSELDEPARMRERVVVGSGSQRVPTPWSTSTTAAV